MDLTKWSDAIVRIAALPPGERPAAVDIELQKVSPAERDIVQAFINFSVASRDTSLQAIKAEFAAEKKSHQQTKEKLDGILSEQAMHTRKMNWGFFWVGCVFAIFALFMCVAAFQVANLTPDQRRLLLWLLPLSSGFAAGSFTGSIKAKGKISTITVAATGGFAVWLITFSVLKRV